MMVDQFMKWVEYVQLQSGQKASDLDDTGLFCTCRQQWEGRFGIQCGTVMNSIMGHV